MEPILFSNSNGIATITLNRPKVYNSGNKALAFAFQEKLRRCQQDTSVRVVCITGTGKAFCAGQDLQEVIDPNGPELGTILRDHYNPIIKQIRALEKPVVAAVNGVAAGAGANIALACDIVVATESASFIQAFSKIGLVPDSGGTFFLPRLIGVQKATALMMLGEKLSAIDAEAMGMIYKVYSDETFHESVNTLLSKLAQLPTKGLAYTKVLLNQSLHNNLNTQLDLEEEIQIAASNTADYKEGVAAFLEKRKPTFKGI
jgi:2-(1,2-epoxy-1,2-dihydrophenyl)acetyl-CoA isomerase